MIGGGGFNTSGSTFIVFSLETSASPVDESRDVRFEVSDCGGARGLSAPDKYERMTPMLCSILFPSLSTPLSRNTVDKNVVGSGARESIVHVTRTL